MNFNPIWNPTAPAWLACVAALLMAGSGALQAQTLLAPPGGVRDDTRALSDAAHTRLVQEGRRFHDDMNCRFWIYAGTFLVDGQTLRQQARLLRQTWSGSEDAVLLAYDRATDAQSLSFSPTLWDRYPSASLITLMRDGATITADKNVPLEERLERSAQLTRERLKALEKDYRQMTQPLPGPHRQLATVCAGILGAGSLLLLILGGARRKQEVQDQEQFLFPEVEVGTRFGAPFGGGVTVER